MTLPRAAPRPTPTLLRSRPGKPKKITKLNKFKNLFFAFTIIIFVQLGGLAFHLKLRARDGRLGEDVAGRPLEVEWRRAEARVRERLERASRLVRVRELDQRRYAAVCKYYDNYLLIHNH